VVLGQNADSFFIAALVDEPAGALRDEEDKEDLDDGWQTLEKRWDTPGQEQISSKA